MELIQRHLVFSRLLGLQRQCYQVARLRIENVDLGMSGCEIGDFPFDGTPYLLCHILRQHREGRWSRGCP
jgi:hypothetical protein